MGSRKFGRIFKPRYRDEQTGEWKHSPFWSVAYTHERKRKSVSSRSKKWKDADRLRKKIFEELWNGRLPWVERNEPTLRKVLDLVETHYDKKKCRSTTRLLLSIGNILKYPTFEGGAILARRVTEGEIEKFVVWRMAWPKGNAPGYINRELAVLRQGFRIAVKRLDEEGRPLLERMPRIEFLTEGKPRQRFSDEHEFAALHAALATGHRNTSPEDVADLALFYHLTGWRNSEPRSLRWPQVNWFRKALTLDPRDSKSDEPWEYPFGTEPELEKLLKKRRRITDETERRLKKTVPWIFHRRVDPHYGTQIKGFRRAWFKACARVGIPIAGAGRLLPHDFRRSRARELMDGNVDPLMACELVGWKSLAMLKRYRITNIHDREAAITKARTAREARIAAHRELPKVGAGGGEGSGDS